MNMCSLDLAADLEPRKAMVIRLYAESFNSSKFREEMGSIEVDHTSDGDFILKHQAIDGNQAEHGFAQEALWGTLFRGKLNRNKLYISAINFLNGALAIVGADDAGIFISSGPTTNSMFHFISSVPKNRDLSNRLSDSLVSQLALQDRQETHDNKAFFDYLLPLGTIVTQQKSEPFFVPGNLKPYDFKIILPVNSDAEHIKQEILSQFGRSAGDHIFRLSDQQVILDKNIITLKSVYANCPRGSLFHTLEFFAQIPL